MFDKISNRQACEENDLSQDRVPCGFSDQSKADVLYSPQLFSQVAQKTELVELLREDAHISHIVFHR